MLIDWFTVGAQTLNFLILVWLLKRYLYQPILDAIDDRERLIAEERADADAKRTVATQEREEFREKNEQFDKLRADLVRQATEDANVERQRLFEEARKDADALRSKRASTFDREQTRLNDEITHRTWDEAFAIARKTLSDLAGVSLDGRMNEVFTQRLRGLNGEGKTVFNQALKSSTDPAVLRSAFDLQPEQRAALQSVLNEVFGANISVRFETAPHLINGIELLAGGQKIAWCIDDYIAKLGTSIRELPAAQSDQNDDSESECQTKADTQSVSVAEAQ
ncbi:MAG: synthase subcomplex subunit [Planctomycetaceae bacterium]|nr:synthase subcomplex subunit [Planctomycetaceae bacterium]